MPPKNDDSVGNLAQRHHRRGLPSNSASTATQVVDEEELEYQENYEKQLQERRKQRAAERRESRQREILSGRIERRPPGSGLSPEFARRLKITGAVLALMVAMVVGVMAYGRLTGSSFFVVKKIDLQGVGAGPKDEIDRQLSQFRGRSIWQLDLGAVRASLEQNSWVQDAEVTRVLPDTLRVTVHERKPVAPGKTASNQIVWIDQDGKTVGDLDAIRMEHMPPIASGLEDGNSDEVRAANRKRMTSYQTLMADLETGSRRFIDEIDEVNLADPSAVKVHLSKYGVQVLLGEGDFRPRFETAMKLIDLIEKKDISSIGFLNKADAERLVKGEKIAYLNVTHPERAIVGFAR